MDAQQLLDWVRETQQQQQQQQSQMMQQLASQFQDQQRLLVQELSAQHEKWMHGAPPPSSAGGPAWPSDDGNRDLGSLPLRLTKMGPGDDPEAYLTTFERVATAARWPEAHWATLLAPYLSGPAQMAYRSLAAREALQYNRVKEAILDQLGINSDTYRQRFRNERFKPGERPRVFAQRLHEWAWRWLEPEQRTGTEVAEMVALEQYVHLLPPGAQKWVRRHQPGTLAAAITLTEAHLDAEGGEVGARRESMPGPATRDAPRARGTGPTPARGAPKPPAGGGRRLAPIWPARPGEAPGEGRKGHEEQGGGDRRAPSRTACYQCGQEGHLKRDCPMMDCTLSTPTPGDPQTGPARPTVTVWLGLKPLQALVDSGSALTLVREELVREAPPTGETAQMKCVHGDVRTYSTVWVHLADGQMARVWRVGKAPNLPLPVVIGRDWPGFPGLLRKGMDRPDGRAPAKEAYVHPRAPSPVAPSRGGGSDDSDFLEEQRTDETLRYAWERAGDPDETDERQQGPRFQVIQDRLYRLVTGGAGEGEQRQLVVPQTRRREVLDLAHTNPWAGHLGREKTLARVLRRFYWPGVYRAVRDFCASCPSCQKVATGAVPVAPLVPLPVVGTPFERVALDLVGPLEPSRAGHRFILVVVDYATRYPEAVPLRNVKAPTLATELLKIFARVGFPQAILTDQGTNVTSQLIKELCTLLRIKTLRTSVYHPQTDGLVERFNRTLKDMLRRVVQDSPRDWDQMLPALMFAIREVPQASTEFSPFELLYGRQPRGILDILREDWEAQSARCQGTVQYILQLREKLRRLGAYAKWNLLRAQTRQAHYYNRTAANRQFEPGDRVLLLLPTQESKLLAAWQGPYEVVRKVGDVNYEVRLTGRRRATQIYHVNLLKKWVAREGLLVAPADRDEDLGPSPADHAEEETPSIGPELTVDQRTQMEELLRRFRHVLTATPGTAKVGVHRINTEPGQVVREAHRPLPRKVWDTVRQEVQTMKQWGVVEESQSEWRSPIVLVPKRDGSVRFCIDFRKVNGISQFDAYPMPRVEELLEGLGRAKYITTLDLSKGYWQIPLEPQDRKKTAFATPFGLFQFRRMPFGLHGAAATFQRVMDQVLEPMKGYAAAYIDDIAVYSVTWPEHLQHLETVMQALQEAGLTANPRKCHFAQREVSYLGYTVGGGQLKPLLGKVEALRNYPPPSTKRQVRGFLGLAGYYRRFVPDFATIAAPLTELTKDAHPNKIQWTAQADQAFRELKRRLVQAPVLRQPDFERPFSLYTDASECGLGAVLAQDHDGEEHPILYLSRKLLPRERNYATIEKEALAVKWAIETLRYYLWGNKFKLITDHAPLVWLNSMKNSNPRLTRWYMALQPYRFDVEYRAGKKHQNADFFSRAFEPVGDEGDPSVRGGVCDGPAPDQGRGERSPRRPSLSRGRGERSPHRRGSAGRPQTPQQPHNSSRRGRQAGALPPRLRRQPMGGPPPRRPTQGRSFLVIKCICHSQQKVLSDCKGPIWQIRAALPSMFILHPYDTEVVKSSNAYPNHLTVCT
ncbi:uncharacterized protein LOC142827431 [Pelodiscus sinensis]|uniref:uncharacterized protein LOC142827431 n=1 Tax=Pelodiscus sinensis TaxID=13735 RepID=UPI003F6CC0E3